jgi:hypothetical protein
MSEPLLYESIHIRDDRQLLALSRRLIGSPHLGRWMKSCFIRRLSQDERISSDFLTPVLLHAPHLRTFVSAVPIHFTAITALSTVAGAALTKLNLVIGRGNQTVLHLIGRFVRLRDLIVGFLDTAHMSFEDVRPWLLPSVKRFHWKWDNNPLMPLESVRFLAACDLANAESLHLTLPGLQPDQSDLLSTFFRNHRKSHVILEVNHPISSESNILAVRRVTFMNALPEASRFDRTDLPELITLHCSHRPDSSIWAFFDALIQAKSPAWSRPLLVLKIIVKDLPGETFRWYHERHSASLSEGLTQFTGQMLQKAFHLSDCNILIIDELEEDLTTSMNKHMVRRFDNAMIIRSLHGQHR